MGWKCNLMYVKGLAQSTALLNTKQTVVCEPILTGNGPTNGSTHPVQPVPSAVGATVRGSNVDGANVGCS